MSNNILNNNIDLCGYAVSVKTVLIVCVIAFVVFLMFKGEGFSGVKKTCSDIPSGTCTSELCEELSFCRPQKLQDSDKCVCKERSKNE